VRYFIFALIFLLTGCAQEQTAEQALSRYLELSDAGLPQQFDQVLTGQAMEAAMQADDVLAELDLIQSGQTEFFDLEQTREDSWIFCLDVSDTKIFDQSGNDLTPPNRPTQLPMMIKVDSSGSATKITQLEIRRLQSC